MDLKTAKKEMEKAEKALKKADRNYEASLKHGSNKQQTTCYDALVKKRDTFEKARAKYHEANRDQPSLKDRVVNSGIAMKVTTGAGIAIACVIAIVAGVSILGKSDSEGDTAATDTV